MDIEPPLLCLKPSTACVTLPATGPMPIFLKTSGRLFVMYVRSLRLERGKRLLESTDLKVSEPADRVGFTSRKKFSKAFQKQEGLTPVEYRERARIQARFTATSVPEPIPKQP